MRSIVRTAAMAACMAAFSSVAVAADDAPEIAPRPPPATEMEPGGYGTIAAPDGTVIDLVCVDGQPALTFLSPHVGVMVAPLPMWWMCIPPGIES